MKKLIIVSTGLFLLAGICGAVFLTVRSKNTIKVGILHSLTGHMALSERPVVDAALLAIEEINAKMAKLLAMKMAKLESGDGGRPPRRPDE